DRKADGQPLDGNIMHDLIVGTLQESRVDRRERLEPFGRETCRESHSVLLGYADVECPAGKFLAKVVKPRTRRHRRGDGDDTVILAGLGDQAIGKDLRIAWRIRL